MSSQRPSFAKRDREMKLKDKARAKAERRAARRAEVRTGHGPPIATDEVAGTTSASSDTHSNASSSPASTPDSDRPRQSGLEIGLGDVLPPAPSAASPRGSRR
jgi:hypothetical protein